MMTIYDRGIINPFLFYSVEVISFETCLPLASALLIVCSPKCKRAHDKAYLFLLAYNFIILEKIHLLLNQRWVRYTSKHSENDKIVK